MSEREREPPIDPFVYAAHAYTVDELRKAGVHTVRLADGLGAAALQLNFQSGGKQHTAMGWTMADALRHVAEMRMLCAQGRL